MAMFASQHSIDCIQGHADHQKDRRQKPQALHLSENAQENAKRYGKRASGNSNLIRGDSSPRECPNQGPQSTLERAFEPIHSWLFEYDNWAHGDTIPVFSLRSLVKPLNKL